MGINGGNAQVVDGGVGKGSITVQSKPVRMGDQGALFVNICSFVSRAFSNICHRLLIHIDRWKLTKNSDPKIARMSNLPQVFTNRTVCENLQ